MSGETEADVSGWTVDTLHTHMVNRIDNLERRLQEREDAGLRAVVEAFAAHEKLTNVQIGAAAKAVDAALASAEKAVGKAEAATEKRFESVNEFRAQLADQAALFLPRTEYAANHDALRGRVSDLTDRLNRSEGKSSGVTATMGVFLAVATVVISIIVVLVNVITG